MNRLVLKRPHTHAGTTYRSGDRIEVDADTAEWLLAQGIAAREPRPLKADPDNSPTLRKDSKS
jgi:hypothetical protein